VEDRELARMHVEVGVHEHHEVPMCELSPAHQRPPLSGIALHVHEAHVWELGRGLLRAGERVVARAVVDEHDLIRRSERRHGGIGLAQGPRDPLGLVERGDHDRDGPEVAAHAGICGRR